MYKIRYARGIRFFFERVEVLCIEWWFRHFQFNLNTFVSDRVGQAATLRLHLAQNLHLFFIFHSESQF